MAGPPVFDANSGSGAVLSYVDLMQRGSGHAQGITAASSSRVAPESGATGSNRGGWRRVKSDSTGVIPVRDGAGGAHAMGFSGASTSAHPGDLAVVAGPSESGARVGVTDSGATAQGSTLLGGGIRKMPGSSVVGVQPTGSDVRHGQAFGASSSSVPGAM